MFITGASCALFFLLALLAQLGTNLTQARRLLEQGQVVAIPTETVYGLAANALAAAAVARIFATKARPHFDPLIVHAHSLEQVCTFTQEIPPLAQRLAAAFWPGPLTLLLPRAACIPDLVTAGLPHVAVRLPRHPLAQQLLQSLPFPLAAPSANPFGYISPTTAQHVAQQLGDRIPYIIDGGPCAVGLESTIVGFSPTGAPVVHRLGGITVEELTDVVGPVQVNNQPTSNPRAPGQLTSHYAPRTPLRLGQVPDLWPTYAPQPGQLHIGKPFQTLDEVGVSAIKNLDADTISIRDAYTPPPRQPLPAPQRIGLLAFQAPYDLPAAHQVVLAPDGNLSTAAQHFFGALRELDAAELDLILAAPVPHQGLGQAINERLQRAAQKC